MTAVRNTEKTRIVVALLVLPWLPEGRKEERKEGTCGRKEGRMEHDEGRKTHDEGRKEGRNMAREERK